MSVLFGYRVSPGGRVSQWGYGIPRGWGVGIPGGRLYLPPGRDMGPEISFPTPSPEGA